MWVSGCVRVYGCECGCNCLGHEYVCVCRGVSVGVFVRTGVRMYIMCAGCGYWCVGVFLL